jgi:hypothetical protein
MQFTHAGVSSRKYSTQSPHKNFPQREQISTAARVGWFPQNAPLTAGAVTHLYI